MNLRRNWTAQLVLGLVLSAGLLLLASCGGGGNKNFGNNNPPPVNNSLSVNVNLGPLNDYVNGFFASVTVCPPGSSTCQVINNLLIDTGSEGLRILSSQASLTLPAVTESGNALHECVQFADGSYMWGPVVSADLQIAGEKASSVPIQIVSEEGTGLAVPTSCSSGGGSNAGSLNSLGAFGILGVGTFRQDCGSGCASSSTNGLYYICPNNNCQQSTASLANQLQNPVWLFAQDNNGVLISLPSVSASGLPTATGSLVFGIGTQSNNALGTAQIYTTDASGNFTTTYKNIAYPQSFIDSGSNGLYFLDASTAGLPACATPNDSFYCPATPVDFTATNAGQNGTSAPVSFSIANAVSLFNSGNSAFNNLGGTNPGAFDWGLPFFFGRSVFVGIEGQQGPSGAVGPYWAY